MKIKTKLFFLFIFLSSILGFAFAEVFFDINASLDSGVYENAIKIDLKTTKENVKIFYSFNPEATPNDLLEYTGSILIKKTTPLVYFAVENYQSETKIKQNDYVINYSVWVKFGTGTQLKNSGDKKVDLSYRTIKTDKGVYTFKEGDEISVGAYAELPNDIAYGSGYIELYSPDGEKKDSIIPVFETKTTNSTGTITTNKSGTTFNNDKTTETKKPIKKEDPKKDSTVIKKFEPKKTKPTETKIKNYKVSKEAEIKEENTKPLITETVEEKPIENLDQTGSDSGIIEENNITESGTQDIINQENLSKSKEVTGSQNQEKNTNLGNDLKTSIQESNNGSITNFIIYTVIGILFLIFLPRAFIKAKNKK
ncbi:MAG: hypothetical protein PHF46_00820 [Candidatus Gracilibacteria bacterium]|nr:hypothetical protein [Candidatus Gracilibacteria bacterium]MDD3119934.1 hypothetical protein [Candidatus Gracilibacteria bacterium]MDD4530154.1 hypothetical protein [Candidatus Gracilibacteria bacterium]